MRWPLTRVPRALPRSSTVHLSPSHVKRQCCREISTWLSSKSASAERPATKLPAPSGNTRGGSPPVTARCAPLMLENDSRQDSPDFDDAVLLEILRVQQFRPTHAHGVGEIFHGELVSHVFHHG